MKLTKLLLLIALLFSTTPLFADESDETIKVVYPLDFADVNRVHFMLNTLNNLIKYYQKNLTDYEISVVAYGPGVQYMLKSDEGCGFKIMPYCHHGGPAGNGTAGRLSSIKQLAGDNIHFYVCENTMKKKHVTKDMLVDYAEVTPGGVLKLIELQRDGAALVKIK